MKRFNDGKTSHTYLLGVSLDENISGISPGENS